MGAAASDYFTSYADVQYGFLDAELGIENFHELAARGDYHRVSVCLKKGLDPNGLVFPEDDAYEREDTPVICCARGLPLARGQERHLRTLEVLVRFGADVNRCNVLEQTALYVACELDLTGVVAWLVAHGADVNRATKAGVSPLLRAYRNGNRELVALLLAHGARAIDRDKRFGSVRFPTMRRELAGENDDHDDSASEIDDDEEDEATDEPSAARDRAKRPPPSPAKQLRAVVERGLEAQQAARDALLAVREEERRIEEQRLYRAQLAVESDQRKSRRRRQRARAKYEKYLAQVEAKRLPPSLVAADDNDDDEVGDESKAESTSRRTRSHPMGTGRGTGQRPATTMATTTSRLVPLPSSLSSSSSRPMTTPGPLRWSRAPPTREGGERPRWVATELVTAARTAKGSDDHDDPLLRECQGIHDELAQRRQRLREIATAPAAMPTTTLNAPSTRGSPALGLGGAARRPMAGLPALVPAATSSTSPLPPATTAATAATAARRGHVRPETAP